MSKTKQILLSYEFAVKTFSTLLLRAKLGECCSAKEALTQISDMKIRDTLTYRSHIMSLIDNPKSSATSLVRGLLKDQSIIIDGLLPKGDKNEYLLVEDAPVSDTPVLHAEMRIGYIAAISWCDTYIYQSMLREGGCTAESYLNFIDELKREPSDKNRRFVLDICQKMPKIKAIRNSHYPDGPAPTMDISVIGLLPNESKASYRFVGASNDFHYIRPANPEFDGNQHLDFYNFNKG